MLITYAFSAPTALKYATFFWEKCSEDELAAGCPPLSVSANETIHGHHVQHGGTTKPVACSRGSPWFPHGRIEKLQIGLC